MKIGIAQITCIPGDIQSNLQKVADYVEQARRNNCDLVIFPEMVDTGYQMDVIKKHASSWDQEPYQRISGLAEQHAIHIFINISEKTATGIYNTLAVLNPDGELIAKYRKAHLAAYAPLHEDQCFAPGNSLETVEVGGLTFGLMICYDLRFPEISRALADKGADALVLVSAWPFPRIIHWNTLIKARAIENQVYVLAANRTGTDDGIVFCGSSQVVDPYGIVKTSASEIFEELIFAEIDRSFIEEIRSKMPLSEHRRRDLY